MRFIAFSVAALLGFSVAVVAPGGAHAATDPNLQVSIAPVGQSAVLGWFGSNAMAYQVEVSSNLTTWNEVGPILPGNNAMLAATRPIPGPGQAFFRSRGYSRRFSHGDRASEGGHRRC